MIIASTPLRISFFGGGSDLPAFTSKEDGATLAVTIDKYVHVIVSPNNKELRFIHENVSDLSTMRNPIASEFFKENNVTKGFDVVSLSDVPSIGSGLGGSSAFTISLIRAFTPYFLSNEKVAQLASEIEIDKCQYPIGVQDQYAIAHGGMHLFKIKHNPREATVQTSFNLSSHSIQELQNRLILIYSGISRFSTSGMILQDQQKEMNTNVAKFEMIRRIRDRAYTATGLLNNGDLAGFGELLHENWMDKKQLTVSLSNPEFDSLYDFALKNGAIGGKLLGAGGGGFFLFYVPSPHIKKTLSHKLTFEFPNSKEYPFKFVGNTTKITRI